MQVQNFNSLVRVRFGVSAPFSSEVFKSLGFGHVVGNIRSYTIGFLREEQGLQADTKRDILHFPLPSSPVSIHAVQNRMPGR